jgi:hypothetical protein
MQFSREPNYFNRYVRSSNYEEWRALAGEVPQSAEFNEIQALLKDKVQQAGEAIFQNGDVVSGMVVTADSANSGKYKTVDDSNNKLWIDGAVHDIPSVSGLEAPASGWGFMGVFLDKFVITANEDQSLRDPVIKQATGQNLGLPGANRLQVVPVWVAGTLVTSDFDNNAAASVIYRDGNGNRLLSSVETSVQVASNAVHSGKFVVPANNHETIDIISGTEVFPELQRDKYLKAFVRIKLPANSGYNTTDLKAYINVFQANLNGQIADTQSFLAIDLFSNNNFKKSLTDDSSVELKLKLTDAVLNILQTNNSDTFKGRRIGVTIYHPDTALPQGTVIYVSDLHMADTETDERRPKFTKYVMANGSSYSNFVPGPTSSLKLGTQAVRQNLSTTSGASLTSYSTPNMPATFTAAGITDLVIRQAQVTPDEDMQFFNAHGVTKEEAFIRVYPVHITKNGQIVSSLSNREFTNISSNFFSERFKSVIKTKFVTPPEVRKLENSTNTVKVKVVDAFVEGRYIAGREDNVVLPTISAGTTTTSINKVFDFVSQTTKYPISPSFTSLSGCRVSVLFIETKTREQLNAVTYNNSSPKDFLGLPISSNNQLMPAYISNVNVEKIEVTRNGQTLPLKRGYENQTDPQAVYELTYETKLDTSGNLNTAERTYPVIKWRNNSTAAVLEPSQGDAYTVYYSATVDLNVVQTETNKQLIYTDLIPGTTKYKSFQLETEVSDNKVRLKNFPDSTFSPFLIDRTNSGNLGLSSGFVSRIHVDKLTSDALNSYVIYLRGDYSSSGPDGYFEYKLINNQEKLSVYENLLKEYKLPICIVKKVPITSYQDIELSEEVKEIEFEQQIRVNSFSDELKKYIPTLLSQNLLTGTTTTDSIKYKKVSKLGTEGYFTSAEDVLIEEVTWKIENTSSLLNGYTVKSRYFYYNHIDEDDTDIALVLNKLDDDTLLERLIRAAGNDAGTVAKFSGLLGLIITEVKNGTTSVFKSATILNYDSAYFNGQEKMDEFETYEEVEFSPLVESVTTIDLSS